jgi:hypothetical protein
MMRFDLVDAGDAIILAPAVGARSEPLQTNRCTTGQEGRAL